MSSRMLKRKILVSATVKKPIRYCLTILTQFHMLTFILSLMRGSHLGCSSSLKEDSFRYMIILICSFTLRSSWVKSRDWVSHLKINKFSLLSHSTLQDYKRYCRHKNSSYRCRFNKNRNWNSFKYNSKYCNSNSNSLLHNSIQRLDKSKCKTNSKHSLCLSNLLAFQIAVLCLVYLLIIHNN